MTAAAESGMLGHKPDQDRKEFVHLLQKGYVSGIGDHDKFALRDVFVNILQMISRSAPTNSMET
jgi:hypothetical protein